MNHIQNKLTTLNNPSDRVDMPPGAGLLISITSLIVFECFCGWRDCWLTKNTKVAFRWSGGLLSQWSTQRLLSISSHFIIPGEQLIAGRRTEPERTLPPCCRKHCRRTVNLHRHASTFILSHTRLWTSVIKPFIKGKRIRGHIWGGVGGIDIKKQNRNWSSHEALNTWMKFPSQTSTRHH